MHFFRHPAWIAAALLGLAILLMPEPWLRQARPFVVGALALALIALAASVVRDWMKGRQPRR